MPASAGQRRIQRARQLGNEHPAAAEILRFYEKLLTFQERIFTDLAQSPNGAQPADWDSATPANRPEIPARYSEFLRMVRESGPEMAARAAAELQEKPPQQLCAALEHFWLHTGAPAETGPAPFLFLSFLQPYAEWTSEKLKAGSPASTPFVCPTCQRKPGVAVLRPLGDGGKRFLTCSFCFHEWEFRRIVCAGCGEEDHRKLPVYTNDSGFQYIRLECCDTCNQYLKAIDLTKNGLAEPVVDEVAAVALDLWARERGYSKIALNVMGL